MTLNQLRVFRAVALTRNINSAARALFVTQPSVSMQLKALETDLKVSLYERRQGQVVLTEAGHILLRYAETILAAEEEATRAMASLRGVLLGTLRIGTNITGGMYVAPSMIRSYRDSHPEVEVTLAIDTSPRIMDSILQGTLDIALIGGPVDKARFEVETVGYDELTMIVSPSHRFAPRSFIAIDELAEENIILPGIGSRSRWLLESILKEKGLAVKSALTMTGTEEVKKAVESNLGVGFVSRYAIKRELLDSTLIRIDISGLTIKRDLELFWKKNQEIPGLAVPFRDNARHVLIREAAENGIATLDTKA